MPIALPWLSSVRSRTTTAVITQTNRTDLGQPAFDTAAEIGVRFDAIDQQQVIGLERGGAHVDGQLVHCADLLDVHARDDRHPDGLARNAVADQDVTLPV